MQRIDINSRKIVIHHTHLIKDIMSLLKDDDIVFFDDCLYSQYLFIKKYIQELQLKNITCILGFSTRILRSSQKPLIQHSAILHNNIHSNILDAYSGFMTIDEIQELLQFCNVYLAGHGAKHLNLEKMNLSKIQQTKLFAEDISIMKKDLDKLQLDTNIFVYPYTYYDFPCANTILKNNGFKHIFGYKDTMRISIENLVNKIFLENA